MIIHYGSTWIIAQILYALYMIGKCNKGVRKVNGVRYEEHRTKVCKNYVKENNLSFSFNVNIYQNKVNIMEC